MTALVDLEKDKFDSDGKIKVSGVSGDSRTIYTSDQITALGSSTDMSLWQAAFHDGQLTYKYCATYDDSDPETAYYTHPDLGNGHKCLKLFYIYKTVNNTQVTESISASIVDWTFDSNVQGSISISKGTVTSPASNAAAGTDVCSITITNTGGGSNTLSLSGTNASAYQLNNTTQSQTGSTLSNVATTDTVVVETAAELPGTAYSHSLTVTLTESAFNNTATVNISTSGIDAPSFTNAKYIGVNVSTSGVDLGVYQGSLDAIDNTSGNFPTGWSTSFWAKASSTSLEDVTAVRTFGSRNGNYVSTDYNLYGTNVRLAGTGTASSYLQRALPGGTDITDWNHYVFTWGTGTSIYNRSVQCYINGATAGAALVVGNNFYEPMYLTTTDKTIGICGRSNSMLSSVTFGNRGTGTSVNKSVNVDEISFWDVTLTGTQVSNIYNSGTPADLDGLSNLKRWFRCGDLAGDTGTSIKDAIDTNDALTGSVDYRQNY